MAATTIRGKDPGTAPQTVPPDMEEAVLAEEG